MRMTLQFANSNRRRCQPPAQPPFRAHSAPAARIFEKHVPASLDRCNDLRAAESVARPLDTQSQTKSSLSRCKQSIGVSATRHKIPPPAGHPFPLRDPRHAARLGLSNLTYPPCSGLIVCFQHPIDTAGDRHSRGMCSRRFACDSIPHDATGLPCSFYTSPVQGQRLSCIQAMRPAPERRLRGFFLLQDLRQHNEAIRKCRATP
jgi:hypothetical protein